MDNIKDLIRGAESILLLSHIDEDTDAFSSSLALKNVLDGMGKKVKYYLSEPIEKRLSFLSDDYEIYDPQKGCDDEWDLVICLDSADVGRLGDRAVFLDRAKMTVCIDHHYTNTGYAKVNRVDGDMSSASEMVYDLICEMGEKITKKTAELLYAGIMSDTGCLKYSCASPKTLRTVAALMECGIDHAVLCRELFDTEDIEVIRLKGYVMDSLESYYGGKLTIAVVDSEIMDKFGVRVNDIGDVVNIPRSVKGTQVALLIKKTTEKIKLSFRSNGVVNVAEIAAKIGGGGHAMAAGASMPLMDLNEAKQKLIKLIGESIND